MRSVLAVAALAVLATGCMSPEARLVGKWKGKLELSGIAENTPIAPMAKTFASMVDPQLDLRPDHTFTLYMSFAPVEGTWELHERTLVLKPEKVLGVTGKDAGDRASSMFEGMTGFKPPTKDQSLKQEGKSPEIRLKVSEDYSKISVEDPTNGQADGLGDVTFSKV